MNKVYIRRYKGLKMNMMSMPSNLSVFSPSWLGVTSTQYVTELLDLRTMWVNACAEFEKATGYNLTSAPKGRAADTPAIQSRIDQGCRGSLEDGFDQRHL